MCLRVRSLLNFFVFSAFIVLCVFLFVLASVSPSLSEIVLRTKAEQPNPECALLFVHGLGGDAIETFTNRNGAYWPDLIRKDTVGPTPLARLDTYSVSYRTPRAGDSILASILRYTADDILESDALRSYKCIIVIAHSLGGIVIQHALNVIASVEPHYAQRFEIAFLVAAPSRGAPLASAVAELRRHGRELGLRIGPLGKLEAELADASSTLELIEDNWQRLGKYKRLPSIYCAYETQRTLGTLLVPEKSLTQSCTERMPINADHSLIVKPDSHLSHIYTWTKSKIVQILAKPKREIARQDTPKADADKIREAFYQTIMNYVNAQLITRGRLKGRFFRQAYASAKSPKVLTLCIDWSKSRPDRLNERNTASFQFVTGENPICKPKTKEEGKICALQDCRQWANCGDGQQCVIVDVDGANALLTDQIPKSWLK